VGEKGVTRNLNRLSKEGLLQKKAVNHCRKRGPSRGDQRKGRKFFPRGQVSTKRGKIRKRGGGKKKGMEENFRNVTHLSEGNLPVSELTRKVEEEKFQMKSLHFSNMPVSKRNLCRSQYNRPGKTTRGPPEYVRKVRDSGGVIEGTDTY